MTLRQGQLVAAREVVLTGLPGRRARFEAIYDANHDRILGYALRRADSAEDARDVVAETFLVAWRRLDDVPEGERARLWLYGTARRVLANQHRGRRRSRRLVTKLQAVPPPSFDEAGDGPEMDGVARAFARLADTDRELLLLVGWEGLGPGDLAEVLACRPGAARARLHRARQRFARELAAEGLQQDGTPGHVPTRRATARPDRQEAL